MMKILFGMALIVGLAVTAGCTRGVEPGGPTNSGTEESAAERLRIAVDQQDVEQARQAIADGADPDHVWNVSSISGDETSPLHRSAGTGQIELVRMLIENGVDVNLTVGGATPLHLAIASAPQALEGAVPLSVEAEVQRTVELNNRIEIIETLVDAGADVNARNELDMTPLDMAHEPRIVALLRAKGAQSTAEIQDQKLQEIEQKGGGLLGGIPGKLEDLKRDQDETEPGASDEETPQDGTPAEDAPVEDAPVEDAPEAGQAEPTDSSAEVQDEPQASQE